MAGNVGKTFGWKPVVLEGATLQADCYVYVWDDDTDVAVNGLITDAQGTIAQQWLSEKDLAVTGTDTVTPDDNTPHLIRLCKYGKIFQEITTSITEGTDPKYYLQANNQVTLSRAAALALAGIVVNHTLQTITVTQSHSIENLYDYTQAEYEGNAQQANGAPVNTTDGTNFTCIYDITVDGAGVQLTGSGQFLNLGSKTFTLANGGGTTLTVTDVNGTSVTTGYEVLAADTGSPLQNIRVALYATASGNLPYQDSVTITRVSTTATVSHTAHGFSVGQKVLIEGPDQVEYRGVRTITAVPTADSYEYTVSGSPTTPATGTITATATIIYDLTNASGLVSDTRTLTAAQGVSGWARDDQAGSPYYEQATLNATVSNTTGLSQTIRLQRDD